MLVGLLMLLVGSLDWDSTRHSWSLIRSPSPRNRTTIRFSIFSNLKLMLRVSRAFLYRICQPVGLRLTRPCSIAEDPRGNTLGRGTEITLSVSYSSSILAFELADVLFVIAGG